MTAQRMKTTRENTFWLYRNHDLHGAQEPSIETFLRQQYQTHQFLSKTLLPGVEFEVLAVEGWVWKVRIFEITAKPGFGFIVQPKLYQKCEITSRSPDTVGTTYGGLWRVLESTGGLPVGVECIQGSLRGSLMPWEQVRMLWEPLPLGVPVTETTT